MLLDQGVDHFLEVAVHEAVDVEDVHADAVVGDAVLDEVVGADFL